MAWTTNPTSRRRFAAAALLAAGLAACGPSAEDIVAEKQPLAQAVFVQIASLAAAVDEVEMLVQDGFDVGGESVVLDGEASNALFIDARDIAAPSSASRDGMAGTYMYSTSGCGEALRGAVADNAGAGSGARVAAMYLTECARAKYVFVLKTHAEQAAELIDNDTFQPGFYLGEVRLYRLADGAYLGGFNIEAASSDQIDVAVDGSGVPTDAIDRLNADLENEVFVIIRDKLKAQLPGALTRP